MHQHEVTPGVPLLQTKLHMPLNRGSQILRSDLIARLDAGIREGHPCAFVIAPAGSGKTTLISQWIREKHISAAWVSLDKEDNDPVRFWTYVCAAMQSIEVNLAQKAFQLLQSPQLPSDEVFLNTLLNEVAAYETQFSLVLDDYHLIETLSVHRALAYFIDYMPSHIQLLISSRIEPPLPLPRLRARGELVEIRAADLAFDEAETDLFLADIMKLDISTEAVTALVKRTEGWAAGLQLAALALRGRADYQGFFQEFTGGHRYILGYFIDEVLGRQPENIQRFLLKTAILQRLNGELCDAVTGESGSHEILEDLLRENLFTVALDEQGMWYRYHHLFQDMLRIHLEKTYPDMIPDLHQRASLWYEKQGLLDQAIEHALATQDLKRAGDLIVDAYLPLWKHSALGTLRRWIDNLPEVAFQQHADLAFWSGALLGYTGRLSEAEQRLKLAEAQWQTLMSSEALSPEQFTRQRGRVAMIRGILAARQGLNADALRLAEEAFALLPPDEFVFRGGAFTVLGLAHLNQGELAEAQQDYLMAAEQARAADHWFLLAGALGRLVPIQIALGQLHAAATTCRQLLGLPIIQSGAFPASGFAHVGLASVFYQQGLLADAEKHAAIGLELGETASIVDLVYSATLVQTLIKAALGRRDESLLLLQRASEIAPKVGGEHVTRRVQATEALIGLQFGELEDAYRWERNLRYFESDDPLLAEFESLVRIRLQLIEGRLAEVVSTLQKLLTEAEATQRMGSVIETLILQARAYIALRQKEHATDVLRQALTLAEPEGYVQVFVNEGMTMVELLRAVGRQTGASYLRSYIGRLLTAFPNKDQGDASQLSSLNSQLASSVLIEPLSERELEVLRLLGEGASNEQIASHLVISIHTVRKHVSNILEKMDAKNRTEAVAYARRSGLL